MSKTRKRMIVNCKGIIIGMDIGKYHHVVVALTPDGSFSKPIKIVNTREGYEELLFKIFTWKKQHNANQVIIGMESTGHYWEVPARWFSMKGLEVVQVNALHTNRAKEIEDNTPGKTDSKDARIIAQLVYYGKYLHCVMPEGPLADLRELVRIRQQIVTELTEKRNYLRRLLDCIFPEIFTVFKKSWGKTFLHLLTLYPLPEQMIDAGLPAMTARLKKQNTHLMVKKLEKVYTLAQTTVGIDVGHTAYEMGIRHTVERILMLQDKKSHVEECMGTLLGAIPESVFIMNFKGVGTVSAAIIFGETGGLTRYSHAEEVLKLAGLNLYEVSSGKHKGRVHISKRGRPLLRHILFLLATIQAKKGMPLYEAYDELMKKNVPAVKALITLSRKLTKILFSLVRDRRYYTEKPPAVLHRKAA
jgi:transposase